MDELYVIVHTDPDRHRFWLGDLLTDRDQAIHHAHADETYARSHGWRDTCVAHQLIPVTAQREANTTTSKTDVPSSDALILWAGMVAQKVYQDSLIGGKVGDPEYLGRRIAAAIAPTLLGDRYRPSHVEVVEMTAEESQELLESESQRVAGVDAEEFARRWRSGYYQGSSDHRLTALAILLPDAREE